MKKLMKFAAASVVAMGMAGQAQATVFYSGPMSGWTTVSDADGDSTWTRNSSNSALDATHVTLNETENLLGIDTYTAAFDFTPLTPNGGILNVGPYAINYTGAVTPPSGEQFKTASLDSTVIPGQTSTNPSVADVNKVITNGDGSTTTLNSINGFPVSAQGINGQTINVAETFTSNGALLTNATNTFTVVPEPGSLLLLGIGLTGLVYGRRKMMHNA